MGVVAIHCNRYDCPDRWTEKCFEKTNKDSTCDREEQTIVLGELPK